MTGCETQECNTTFELDQIGIAYEIRRTVYVGCRVYCLCTVLSYVKRSGDECVTMSIFAFRKIRIRDTGHRSSVRQPPYIDEKVYGFSGFTVTSVVYTVATYVVGTERSNNIKL